MIEYDSTGVPVSSWTARAPTSKAVCNLGGQPAIGRDVVNSHVLVARDREEAFAASDRICGARIVCTDGAAYVATEYPESADTVFVYHRSGEETGLPVPTEFTEDLPECTLRSSLSNGVVLRGQRPGVHPGRREDDRRGRGEDVMYGGEPGVAGRGEAGKSEGVWGGGGGGG